MLNAVRLMVIKSVLPTKWRLSQQAAAEALNRFAEVEADSAWQYYNAMRFTTEADMTEMLFRNVVDEFGHADAFQRIANRLSNQRFRPTSHGRKALVASAQEIEGFLAFTHESERVIGRQFATYAKASPLAEVGRVFTSIAQHEVAHHLDARAYLECLLASRRRAGWFVLRAKLSRALDQFERFGEHIGVAVFGIALGAIYLVSGLFLSRYCRVQSQQPNLSRMHGSQGSEGEENLRRRNLGTGHNPIEGALAPYGCDLVGVSGRKPLGAILRDRAGPPQDSN